MGVAPLAGAWIETSAAYDAAVGAIVAPLAGAWIETSGRMARQWMRLSPPSRGRGLKHVKRTLCSM